MGSPAALPTLIRADPAEHQRKIPRNAISDPIRQQALSRQTPSAEAVIQRTRTLAAIEATKRDAVAPSCDQPATPRVHVPLPDLNRFNQLLSSPAAEGPVSVFFA
jgi:hypothetical protein